MEKPMVAKIAGIITLMQLGLSFFIGVVGGLSGGSGENTATLEVNGGNMILIVILISMVIMIIASILLLRGNKHGRMLYLIGTVLTLAGNIVVAGIVCGLQSSFIPLLFTVLLYTRKSAREYYREIK